jgi:hypothetical protein
MYLNFFARNRFHILIIFFTAYTQLIQANTCPDLAGIFQCSNPDGQPFLMEVSQIEVENVTTYTYVYDGGLSSYTQKVSDTGEINFWDPSKPEFYVARCGGDRVNYFQGFEGRLFVHDLIDPLDMSYVETIVRNDGSEVEYIRCPRK